MVDTVKAFLNQHFCDAISFRIYSFDDCHFTGMDRHAASSYVVLLRQS